MGFCSLLRALELSSGGLVTVVGAGGKTTLVYRLAAELKGLLPATAPVLISTTTKMWLPQPGEVDRRFWAPSLAQLRDIGRQWEDETKHDQLGSGPGASPRWFIGRSAWPHGKVQGLPRWWLDELHRQVGPGGVILVEADGAAGKPVKIPDWYEPQVPSSSTIILVVAGMSSLGLPFSSRYVHRAGLAHRYLGWDPPGSITPPVLAQLIAYQAGRAQSMAPEARTVAVLNQTDTAERLVWGREVAWRLVDLGWPSLLTSFSRPEPVVELVSPQVSKRRPRVAAIVLAAGTSSRMAGSNKLALPWGRHTILQQVVDTACRSRAAEVVVVLGHQAAELKAGLRSYPVRLVFNPRFQEGQSTSLRAGLEVVGPETDAVVFLLGDQPLVTSQVIDALIDAYALFGSPVVVPTFQGQRGNPALFSRHLFPELMQISGDRGGRPVLEHHRRELLEVPVACRGILADVDDLPSYRGLKPSDEGWPSAP